MSSKSNLNVYKSEYELGKRTITKYFAKKDGGLIKMSKKTFNHQINQFVAHAIYEAL